jgi:hypothetical protein
LRPYKAAARLRNLAETTLKGEGGLRLAALIEVVARHVAKGSQPTEEQMGLIAAELKNNEAARQWLEALAAYVVTLNSTEIGWTADESVDFVMGKYGTELTQGEDMRGAMFIQMYLQSAVGKSDQKLTQGVDMQGIGGTTFAQMHLQSIGR